MMTNRDTAQFEAVQAWEEAGMKGTIILPTGFGKTRCGVMARERLGDLRTLVITSRVPLIKQWQETFGDNPNIDYLCIQTAYKEKEVYDLVIIDEVHRSLSPKYRAVFENISYKYIICLTATIPKEEEYREILERYAPIVYRKVLDEAVNMSILPDFDIINYEVPFDKKQKYKYDVFDRQFREALIALMQMKSKDPLLSSKYKSAFDIAKDMKDLPIDSQLRRMSRQFWSAMTMRKQAVYNNVAKLKIAVDIVNQNKKRKWILFTKSISFASELQKMLPTSLLYHSKQTKVEREFILELYTADPHGVIIAVDALTEGFNSTDANSAICLSGVSTELDNIQKLGRILRPKTTKPAFINFYTEGTVEKGWVETKTAKSGLKNYTKWSKHPLPISLD